MRTPILLLNQYGYCPYCLAIKNVTTQITCRTANMTITPGLEVSITNPIELIRWLDEMVNSDDFVSFGLNASPFAFIPVAVIRDTPLCPVHLLLITDLDISRYRTQSR